MLVMRNVFERLEDVLGGFFGARKKLCEKIFLLFYILSLSISSEIVCLCVCVFMFNCQKRQDVCLSEMGGVCV